MFNAKQIKAECVEWIRQFFEENGKGCSAVIGISGGKDSSVVAALCVEALGKNNVIGVLMPNGTQSDIDYAYDLVNCLGIPNITVNIADAVNATLNNLGECISPTEQARINLPPRIRMATLYAVSQTLNGRVANTCNLSEDYIGYSTRYGDSVGDFAPISNLTSDEVIAIGIECGLTEKLVNKVPSDGLCGKTDEDNFGFTYEVLNKYIRTGICEDEKTKESIDYLNKKNAFKLKPIPSYHPNSKGT